MQATTNYDLPLYEGGDSVNLLAGYNVAITKIDAKLKELSDVTPFNPQPQTDANFDVAKLGQAKITADGIIYFIGQ